MRYTQFDARSVVELDRDPGLGFGERLHDRIQVPEQFRPIHGRFIATRPLGHPAEHRIDVDVAGPVPEDRADRRPDQE